MSIRLGNAATGRLVRVASSILIGIVSGCASVAAAPSPSEQPAPRSVAAEVARSAIAGTQQPRLPSETPPAGVRLAVLPDGDLGIDCAPIRSAIAARRAQQQWGANADAEALALLNEAPHQYVSPDYLVEFLVPAVGHGRESGIGFDEQKMYVRMKLCDQYYREIVTRQFVAQYPSFR